MAAFLKFNKFSQSLVQGLCGDMQGADVKFALTNTAPAAPTTQTVFDVGGLHPPPAEAHGYTSGGHSATISGSAETGGVYTYATTTDVVITAAGGTIGPFRYVILYVNAGTLPLIGYWDYLSSITLQVGETFTIDVGTSLFTITTT